MIRRRSKHQYGFSLIELVIVIVIMGIIAAIAIPRLSRIARTSKDIALKQNLAMLRGAIEQYAAEHDGKYPPTTNIRKSLSFYTNLSGNMFAEDKDVAQGIVYGPYIDDRPPMPVGNAVTPVGFARVDDPAAIPPKMSNLTAG